MKLWLISQDTKTAVVASETEAEANALYPGDVKLLGGAIAGVHAGVICASTEFTKPK